MFEKAEWLPGRITNIRPTGSQVISEVVCFQRGALFAEAAKRPVRQPVGCASQGISGLRIFGMIPHLASENAGLCMAAVVQAALRHVKELAGCACAACGRQQLLVAFWCGIHIALCG